MPYEPTVETYEYNGDETFFIVTYQKGTFKKGIKFGRTKAKVLLDAWAEINNLITAVDRSLPLPENTEKAEYFMSDEFKGKRYPCINVITGRSGDGKQTYGISFGVTKALLILRFKAEIEKFVGAVKLPEPEAPAPPAPDEELPF